MKGCGVLSTLLLKYFKGDSNQESTLLIEDVVYDNME